VDPLALGQRYVEQEAICRELRTAHAANFDKNQSVLTEAQRTKLRALDAVVDAARLASSAAATDTQKARLKALEEAARLSAVASEAHSANLYRRQFSFADLLLGGVGGIGVGLGLPTGIINGFPAPLNRCSLNFGGFNFIPPVLP
jgi:hypothetical protein